MFKEFKINMKHICGPNKPNRHDMTISLRPSVTNDHEEVVDGICELLNENEFRNCIFQRIKS
jgi:hypothetical protein